jgi:hypothetical protein
MNKREVDAAISAAHTSGYNVGREQVILAVIKLLEDARPQLKFTDGIKTGNMFYISDMIEKVRKINANTNN